MQTDYTVPEPAAEDVEARAEKRKRVMPRRPCKYRFVTGCPGEARVLEDIGRDKSRIIDDAIIITRKVRCDRCGSEWVTNERSPILPPQNPE